MLKRYCPWPYERGKNAKEAKSGSFILFDERASGSKTNISGLHHELQKRAAQTMGRHVRPGARHVRLEYRRAVWQNEPHVHSQRSLGRINFATCQGAI